MKRNRRWAHARRKQDSIWELDLSAGILNKYQPHPEELITYSIPKTYHPDFIRTIGSQTVFVESKGFFTDRDEMRKYLFIRDAIESQGNRFVFLFWNKDYKVPGSRPRKDGTRMVYSEWADKNNFEWYDEDTFPKELQ